MSMPTPLAAYQSWDLTQPSLPPRSRLYCLEPIGVGTSMVESLTGYLARLAEAHCVTPWTLYRHEIAPRLQRAKFGSLCLAGSTGYQPRTINGTGGLALDFSRTLESLTRQRDLSPLTLLKWAAALPRQGLLRRTRAWCVDCLQSWRAAGQAVYEPLLWTLQPVAVCPRHQRPLSLICPFCQLQNGTIDARLWPGHCSRCLRWLAPEEALGEQPICKEGQLWVVNGLGELLAAGSQISPKPAIEFPKRTLAAVLSQLSESEISLLTDWLKISRHSFNQWQMGASLPRLHSLLKICYSLDLSLADLVSEKELKSPARIVRSAPEIFLPEFKPRQPRCKLKSGDVERSLQAALEEAPPVSVSQVINRLGLKKSGGLCGRFPELCAAVAKRHAEHRKSVLAKRKEEAVVEVRRVAREMYDAGLPLRSRDICSRLTMGGLYRPEGRAALRAIKDELGLE